MEPDKLGSSSLQSRRVLVTGGGGFIGTRLCRRLATQQAEIHAVGRNRPSHLDGIATTWAVDISREEDARKLIATIRPEIIFHLASVVTGSRDIDRVRPTFESNLASTVNILITATEAHCERIVMTGSMEEPRPEDPDSLPLHPTRRQSGPAPCMPECSTRSMRAQS